MTEAIARRWRAARPIFEETSRVILSPSAARARAQSMTSRGDVTATLRATYAAHLHLHLHYYHYRSGLIKRHGRLTFSGAAVRDASVLVCDRSCCSRLNKIIIIAVITALRAALLPTPHLSRRSGPFIIALITRASIKLLLLIPSYKSIAPTPTPTAEREIRDAKRRADLARLRPDSESE